MFSLGGDIGTIHRSNRGQFMSTPKKSLLPVHIPLLENQSLAANAIFVRLPTLAALEQCWATQRRARPFAAKGISSASGQRFLNDLEWVFAPTKAALIASFTRWEQAGICVRWYDWKADGKANPSHAEFFKNYGESRDALIARGEWTLQDEVDHLEYSPERYTGEWVVENLPGQARMGDWFGPGFRSLIDRTFSIPEVTRIMQERTFDHWCRKATYDIQVLDSAAVDEEIECWRTLELDGRGWSDQESTSARRPKGPLIGG